MVDPSLASLSEWESFYVITGSAGAGLTGLMFVVLALGSEVIAEGGESGVRAFGTPTVLHFCGVLLIAAILSIPHQTATTLAFCVGATGIAGLALSTWVVVQARRQSSYTPVFSDWIWHVAVPLIAYAAVAAAAGLLSRWPTAALDLVAAASLLLLFTGIHNAWDAAVWIASRRR
jgi:hypothetical protein